MSEHNPVSLLWGGHLDFAVSRDRAEDGDSSATDLGVYGTANLGLGYCLDSYCPDDRRSPLGMFGGRVSVGVAAFVSGLYVPHGSSEGTMGGKLEAGVPGLNGSLIGGYRSQEGFSDGAVIGAEANVLNPLFGFLAAQAGINHNVQFLIDPSHPENWTLGFGTGIGF